jgi:hypothetical protein
MGIQTIPAPAAGKTAFRTTLTSGTSYTVPAGVSYLNVTLVGGGGGGAGGTAGALNCAGGPGATVSSTLSATAGASIAYAIGAGGGGGTPDNSGSAGGTTTFTGATSASGGGAGVVGPTTSPTALVGFANNGGVSGPRSVGSGPGTGATGSGGFIIVEYWA